MKRFVNIAALVCGYSFFLMFFSSPLLCQPWAPPYSPAPYYSPSPINININMSGYPGSYTNSGYSFPSYIPSFSSSYQPTAQLILEHSTTDGDYIYVVYQNMLNIQGNSRGECGVAIFESSGSDDYEYLSQITLFNGTSLGVPPIPQEMSIQGDLAVIGTFSLGIVYLVDISDKDDPELINEVYLDEGGRISGLIIRDKVLFLGVESGVTEDNESMIYAYDISDPDDTDEDDDLLDSYDLDDYDIQGMAAQGDYLFISGREVDEDPSILIFNIAEPDNISLVKTFDDLDGDEYGTVGLAVSGEYLFSTIDLSEGSSDYEDHEFRLKIIDISDPLNPELVFSSERLEGTQLYGNRNIVIRDNYAFLLTTLGSMSDWNASSPSWWMGGTGREFGSKIYVFDISTPGSAELVETTKEYDGAGRAVYIANGDLCLHADEVIKIFDLSNPEDLSAIETVDIYDIIEDELGPLPQYYSSYPTFGPAYVYPANVSPGYRYNSYYGTPFNSGPGYNTYTGFMQPPGGYYNYGPGYGQPPYGGSGFYGPGYSYGPPAYNYGPPAYNYGPPSYSYGQPPFHNGWWNSGPRNTLPYNEFPYQNYGTYNPYLSSSFGPPPYSNGWWFR